MTTTVASLVERVRDLLDDYPDSITTLASAITDTSTTSIALASAAGVAKTNWLSIDFETLFVDEVPTGPPYTTTVRRGQKGTTAATHASGATVYVDPLYPSNRILGCLNAALGKMTKTVKDIATLTAVDDVYAYTVPSTVEAVKRVEIENSDETNQFATMRNWEMFDATTLHIFGDYPNTRNIAVIGTAKFTAMSTTGNLDSTYADDNANAINFLIYEAAGQLLLQRQGKIAGRDSFEGITDPFAQNFPDQSVRTAVQYLAQADRYRREAIRQKPILQAPSAPTQDPGRSYLART